MAEARHTEAVVSCLERIATPETEGEPPCATLAELKKDKELSRSVPSSKLTTVLHAARKAGKISWESDVLLGGTSIALVPDAEEGVPPDDPEASMAGVIDIQFDGSGDFHPFRMLLVGFELQLRNSLGKVVRTADATGSTTDLPKNKRKGHNHLFRIDLVSADSGGSLKYICSVGNARQLSDWLKQLKLALNEADQDNPLGDTAQPTRKTYSGRDARADPASRGRSFSEILHSETQSGSEAGQSLSAVAEGAKGELGAKLAAKTPEEALAALKTDPIFAEEIKAMATSHVENAVRSIEIPPISGSQEWGTYAIEGLAVASLDVDTDQLTIDIGDTIYVELKNVLITFDDFKFIVDKQTFPKVKDEGTAEATATFDGVVKFEIVATGGQIHAEDLIADVTIGDLPVKVLTGSHKFLFNMLLSIFAKKLKEAITTEVGQKVDDSTPMLQKKIADVAARFSPDLTSSALGALEKTAEELQWEREQYNLEQETSRQLLENMQSARKCQLSVINNTSYTFRLQNNDETPTLGTWIVPPPERLRPGETGTVFGTAAAKSLSGTEGTVSYTYTARGSARNVVKFNWIVPFAGKATATTELSGVGGVRAAAWLENAAADFGKVSVMLDEDPEDMTDCVALRNTVVAEAEVEELAHHSDYDDHVRVHARECVHKAMRVLSIGSGHGFNVDQLREQPQPQYNTHSDQLVVHIGSWNAGNEAPHEPEGMDPWVPRGGRGADIIVLCTQECTYDESKAAQEEIVGRLKVWAASAQWSVGGHANERHIEISLEPEPEVKKWKSQVGKTSAGNWNPKKREGKEPEAISAENKKKELLPYYVVYKSSARLVVRLLAGKTCLAQGEVHINDVEGSSSRGSLAFSAKQELEIDSDAEETVGEDGLTAAEMEAVIADLELEDAAEMCTEAGLEPDMDDLEQMRASLRQLKVEPLLSYRPRRAVSFAPDEEEEDEEDGDEPVGEDGLTAAEMEAVIEDLGVDDATEMCMESGLFSVDTDDLDALKLALYEAKVEPLLALKATTSQKKLSVKNMRASKLHQAGLTGLDFDVQLTPAKANGEKDAHGTVHLKLSYDVHVDQEQLTKQSSFSSQAAAEVERHAAETVDDDTLGGTLKLTQICAAIGDGLVEACTCNCTVGEQHRDTGEAVAGITGSVEWSEELQLTLESSELALPLSFTVITTDREDNTETVGRAEFDISILKGQLKKKTEQFELTLTGGKREGLTLTVQMQWEPEGVVDDDEQQERTAAMEDSAHFFQTVKKAAGSQFYEVGRRVLWQIQMIVLARYDIKRDITGVEFAEQKTGLAGGLIANKGGVVCKLAYRGHELCFVNTHLAAHEGLEHRLDRNRMAREVQEGARVGNKLLDPSNQFHHTFWAGDLNYRVEFKDWVLADGSVDKSVPHELKMKQGKQLIQLKRWDVLQAADELRREMLAERVFSGWQDSACEFPPTFKVERGYELQYNNKRVPSYCDRILWRSSGGFDRLIRQETFNAAPNLITSDHKPVWGRFRVSVPRDLASRARNKAQPSRVVAFLCRTKVMGMSGFDTHTMKLFAHDGHSQGAFLQQPDKAQLADLSGHNDLCLPSRIPYSDLLHGTVKSPADAGGVDSDQSAAFSESLSLRVVEDGAVLQSELGFATLALRDPANEVPMSADDNGAVLKSLEKNFRGKFRGSILSGLSFPVVRRELSLPLTLNGVRAGATGQGLLRSTLLVVETYTPLWEIVANGTVLRTELETKSKELCKLKQGTRVLCLGRKREGAGGKSSPWQCRVLVWREDSTKSTIGWLPEKVASSAKQEKNSIAKLTAVCGHFVRRPGLRRGWFLRKTSEDDEWKRVWCQCSSAVSTSGADAETAPEEVDCGPIGLKFFESNEAGEGTGYLADLDIDTAGVVSARVPDSSDSKLSLLSPLRRSFCSTAAAQEMHGISRSRSPRGATSPNDAGKDVQRKSMPGSPGRLDSHPGLTRNLDSMEMESLKDHSHISTVGGQTLELTLSGGEVVTLHVDTKKELPMWLEVFHSLFPP